ncbi:MAG TPA: hypothetical protein VMZ53_18945 [Kofleriaceae bacterium]|nr:hypothetical protein [Kofleriaceae bacterium]
MRLVVLLGLIAGCSFEHGRLGPTQADAEVDATGPVVIDAAIDAKIDAPPTTCPDDDADSVCNDVDDWPCGAKPSTPSATVQFMNNGTATTTTISVVDLDSTGRMAIVAPQTTVSLGFRLQVTDTACSGNCVDQLEAGWVDHATGLGNRFTTCLYDDPVSKMNGLDTSLSFNVGAPATRKVYDLRVNLGQNFYCGANGTTGWWGGAVPPDTKTIARLCVH